MKRRLLNTLVGVSVVLSVATAALWVRSLWFCDAIGWSDSRYLVRVGTTFVPHPINARSAEGR